ncbi:unnamed protein product, partial [Polarella glacialis]
AGVAMESRLCLAFAQFSACSNWDRQVSPGRPPPLVLTTPLSLSALLDLLRWRNSVAGGDLENLQLSNADSVVSSGGIIGCCSRQPSSCWSECRRLLLRWRDLGSWGPPEAALMTLVILLAFDLMAFIMMIDHLWKINDLAMFVFIFLPPLV